MTLTICASKCTLTCVTTWDVDVVQSDVCTTWLIFRIYMKCEIIECVIREGLVYQSHIFRFQVSNSQFNVKLIILQQTVTTNGVQCWCHLYAMFFLQLGSKSYSEQQRSSRPWHWGGHTQFYACEMAAHMCISQFFWFQRVLNERIRAQVFLYTCDEPHWKAIIKHFL